MNIVNDQIAAESVNIDNAVYLGTHPTKEYEKWHESFKKREEFMTLKDHVTVGDTKRLTQKKSD